MRAAGGALEAVEQRGGRLRGSAGPGGARACAARARTGAEVAGGPAGLRQQCRSDIGGGTAGRAGRGREAGAKRAPGVDGRGQAGRGRGRCGDSHGAWGAGGGGRHCAPRSRRRDAGNAASSVRGRHAVTGKRAVDDGHYGGGLHAGAWSGTRRRTAARRRHGASGCRW